MSKADQSLQTLRARLDTFWAVRTDQERRLLSICAVVVGLGLFYSVLVGPALDGRAQLQKDLPLAHQQAAEMQLLSREAQALKGQTDIAPTPMTQASLIASLSARGLNPQSLNATGEYAKVQLNGVHYPAVVAWLDVIRTESRINVVDASFVAQDAPGSVNASLTLRQGVR